MIRIYLTRRNLQALLSKLDRAARGEETSRTIVKNDLLHPKYPCSARAEIIAIEDAEYYGTANRAAGPVHADDL